MDGSAVTHRSRPERLQTWTANRVPFRRCALAVVTAVLAKTAARVIAANSSHVVMGDRRHRSDLRQVTFISPSSDAPRRLASRRREVRGVRIGFTPKRNPAIIRLGQGACICEFAVEFRSDANEKREVLDRHWRDFRSIEDAGKYAGVAMRNVRFRGKQADYCPDQRPDSIRFWRRSSLCRQGRKTNSSRQRAASWSPAARKSGGVFSFRAARLALAADERLSLNHGDDDRPGVDDHHGAANC